MAFTPVKSPTGSPRQSPYCDKQNGPGPSASTSNDAGLQAHFEQLELGVGFAWTPEREKLLQSIAPEPCTIANVYEQFAILCSTKDTEELPSARAVFEKQARLAGRRKAAVAPRSCWRIAEKMEAVLKKRGLVVEQFEVINSKDEASSLELHFFDTECNLNEAEAKAQMEKLLAEAGFVAEVTVTLGSFNAVKQV